MAKSQFARTLSLDWFFKPANLRRTDGRHHLASIFLFLFLFCNKTCTACKVISGGINQNGQIYGSARFCSSLTCPLASRDAWMHTLYTATWMWLLNNHICEVSQCWQVEALWNRWQLRIHLGGWVRHRPMMVLYICGKSRRVTEFKLRTATPELWVSRFRSFVLADRKNHIWPPTKDLRGSASNSAQLTDWPVGIHDLLYHETKVRRIWCIFKTGNGSQDLFEVNYGNKRISQNRHRIRLPNLTLVANWHEHDPPRVLEPVAINQQYETRQESFNWWLWVTKEWWWDSPSMGGSPWWWWCTWTW